jgi:hypothetical protein
MRMGLVIDRTELPEAITIAISENWTVIRDWLGDLQGPERSPNHPRLCRRVDAFVMDG